jgi:hypothetical protein
VENVNLSTVIAYKKDGVKHHFLETYYDADGCDEGDSAADTDFDKDNDYGSN